MTFTPKVLDPVVDLAPITSAYSAAFLADSSIGGAGIYVGYGDAAPQNPYGSRIALKMRGNPEYTYGDTDVRGYLDVAVTTTGRDIDPTYALAAAVQRVVLSPTVLITPDGYKPIRTAQLLQIIPRDPPPEAGKTVRVLVAMFTMLVEKV